MTSRTSICMNCENAFINNGPYFTCGKCHGPCDTFRYSSYEVDESFHDSTQTHQNSEKTNENPWAKFQDQPFRRKVPKPPLSRSTSLRKSQSSDRVRVLGYRFIGLCSRYADPYTWLGILRDSKNRYDVKTKAKMQTENVEEKQTGQ